MCGADTTAGLSEVVGVGTAAEEEVGSALGVELVLLLGVCEGVLSGLVSGA
ncbi:hypothetical protein ABH920_006485 [Catenulispora sp. EB89]|uniref:hypothetical protein n=1 Tax=Catenulispora sp. EB89 TaxID=3156257 RepID=UPI003511D16D